MCFTANKITFKVAKRDKTYYKVLQIKENGKYYPPYRDIYSVSLYEVTEPYFLDKIDIYANKHYPISRIEVTSGFIHLYRTYFRAKVMYETIKNNHSKYNNYVIVKAIVPKGALYAKNITEVITDMVIYKEI